MNRRNAVLAEQTQNLDDGHDGVVEAKQVIRTVEVDQLERVRPVQGFEFSGVGIIMHVVEHLSYHTGQIAFWAKYLKQVDLGFYADFDLNTKNED